MNKSTITSPARRRFLKGLAAAGGGIIAADLLSHIPAGPSEISGLNLLFPASPSPSLPPSLSPSSPRPRTIPPEDFITAPSDAGVSDAIEDSE